MSKFDTATQKWRFERDYWYGTKREAEARASHSRGDGLQTVVEHKPGSRTMWGTSRRATWRVSEYGLIGVKMHGVWHEVTTQALNPARLYEVMRFHKGKRSVKVRGFTYYLR